MPEGPEVETVRRSLVDVITGRAISRVRVSRLALRTPVKARAFAPLVGRRIADVRRHGKLLWLAIDDARGSDGVFVRLGMTGRLVVQDSTEELATHTHVRITLDDGACELRYVDARRFGEVVPFAGQAARDDELGRMGPDGITLDDAGRDVVVDTLRRTARSLKDALLDQRVIAGVGNIYAAEALFCARLSPFRAGASLSVDEARRLVDAARTTLQAAVQRRGTSFSDYVDGFGARGDNQDHLLVFQREGAPCPACAGLVERVVQGARSTFWCPRCQGG